MEENKNEIPETKRTRNGGRFYSMARKYATRDLEL
jgi:hypothetical protein